MLISWGLKLKIKNLEELNFVIKKFHIHPKMAELLIKDSKPIKTKLFDGLEMHIDQDIPEGWTILVGKDGQLVVMKPERSHDEG